MMRMRWWGLACWCGSLAVFAGALRAQELAGHVNETQMTASVVSTTSNVAGLDESREPEPITVSMDFQDARLKDVLKAFSQQTGINVIASEKIGEKTVTLYLEEVTSLDALDQVLRAADLTYDRPAGSQIYIVKPTPPVPEVPKVVAITRVYRLQFARVSSSRLSRAAEALGSITPFEAQQLTALALTQGGGAGGGGAAAGPGGGIGGGGAAREVGIDKVIENLLTEEGDVVVDERTNSLVVTDVPENFPRIEAVLAALDVKTAQILIESEVLETTLSRLKDLGIEWGTGTEGALLQLNPAQRATKFPFVFPKEGPESFVAPEGGSFPSFTRAGQISLGTLDASQFNAVLQALERDTDTRILARPKVLTLENESAVIRLTSQQAVAIQTVTVSETGDIFRTPERVITGVILVVTPQVNQDGFVTMLVEPSVTSTVTSQIASDVVDPKTRSARAFVRIRQGETLVLGGLIDRSETETLQRVPILSRIPILGEAFKNKEIDDTATELIVFVTPRVLAEPGVHVAAAGEAPYPIREQEIPSSREEVIQQTLGRLEATRP